MLFIVCFLSVSFALTSPYEKEKQLGIDLYLEADSLVYTPPTWFKPSSLAKASEDASYWIHKVLPYEQDRYEDMYLVIPQIGAVMPINPIPEWTSDYNNMKAGKQIGINKYLKSGIIEYVWSVDPGYRGKRIDFGHSNFYKSDDGRYKSIFANLMALDVNDQVRYYVKQWDGTYKLFKYIVTASYNTYPSNVQALQWDGEGADALIFGCTHGLDGRWMIEAEYMWEPLGRPIVEMDPYDTLSYMLRWKVNRAVRKISRLPHNKKVYAIISLFKLINRLKGVTENNDKLLLLDYIETRLAEIYPE